MMTASMAFDECVARMISARRASNNALAIGNKTMAGRFSAEARQARSSMNDWLKHPALRCTIRPCVGGFLVRDAWGRPIVKSSSLRGAERAASDNGFRHIDIAACGRFA